MTGKKFFNGIVSVILLLSLVTPILQLPSSDQPLRLWAIVLLLLTIFSFAVYNFTVKAGIYTVLRSVILPLLILFEVALIILSYGAHWTKLVTWKGRPIAVSERIFTNSKR